MDDSSRIVVNSFSERRARFFSLVPRIFKGKKTGSRIAHARAVLIVIIIYEILRDIQRPPPTIFGKDYRYELACIVLARKRV